MIPADIAGGIALSNSMLAPVLCASAPARRTALFDPA